MKRFNLMDLTEEQYTLAARVASVAMAILGCCLVMAAWLGS